MRFRSIAPLLGFGVAVCGLAFAQPADYKSWSPRALYDYGFDRLKHGRSFNSAISILKEAAERDAANREFAKTWDQMITK